MSKRTQKGSGKCDSEKSSEVSEILSKTNQIYLINTQEKSNKFWEIVIDDKDTTTRYGKIGLDGTKSSKTHKDKEQANKFAFDQTCSKISKGYTIDNGEKQVIAKKSSSGKIDKKSSSGKIDIEEREIEDLQENIRKIQKEIDSLLENKILLMKKVQKILESRKEREIKKNIEIKKKEHLERLKTLKTIDSFQSGVANSFNISGDLSEDIKEDIDSFVEGKTVDQILKQINREDLIKSINIGDLINFGDYRHYSCMIVNHKRRLIQPDEVENYVIPEEITSFLEDPVRFYEKINQDDTRNEGCAVAYVDFNLNKVKEGTRTKEEFDKYDVSGLGEDTVFSYGYYEDSLLADGEELNRV